VSYTCGFRLACKSEIKEHRFLGSDALYCGRNLLTFQTHVLHLYHRTLKMETEDSSETLVNLYQTTRDHSPEDISGESDREKRTPHLEQKRVQKD
jgi:hypothetical protein